MKESSIENNNAQGSLEYLLILAAVLAIAVVVVVVANSMMSPAEASADVSEIKYRCSMEDIELIGFDEVCTTQKWQCYNKMGVKYKGEELEDMHPGKGPCPQSSWEAYCKVGSSPEGEEIVVYVAPSPLGEGGLRYTTYKCT